MKVALPPNLSIESLKQRLAQVTTVQVRSHGGAPLPTGLPELDRVLGGGLPRGRLVEVTGRWSSGKATLALAAAARLTAVRRPCVYVDGRGELYPPSAAALGVELGCLLIVRARLGAARAGEIAARSGAFPLIVLDLADGERIEDAAAGRLRAAAAAGGSVVLALAPRPGALAAAVLKLECARGTITLRKGGAAPPGTEVPLVEVDRTYTTPLSLDLPAAVIHGPRHGHRHRHADRGEGK
jgi:recombination protein RecA